MANQILIAPGFGGSDDGHWQSYWQKENKEYIRIEQDHWFQPAADEWVAKIEESVRNAKGDVFIVAHSLACLALAFWAQQTTFSIKGALLVAPPDASNEKLVSVVKGFSSVPLKKLSFPSIVVASTNDEYMSIEKSEALAAHWGSTFVNIGEKGHINGKSDILNWPEGRVYLNKLVEYP
jgi:uncharacterized protein